MDEDGYMQNRVGVQMMELDAIMEEQAKEEVASRDAMATLDKVLKQYDFFGIFIRPYIPYGKMLLDNFFAPKEALIY